MLYANLLIGAAGLPPDSPPPVEFFPGAQPLWRTRLPDGRIAIEGFTLSVEVTQISTALQNKQLATAVRQLDDKEELTMAIPFENLKLVATDADINGNPWAVYSA